MSETEKVLCHVCGQISESWRAHKSHSLDKHPPIRMENGDLVISPETIKAMRERKE